MKCVAFAVNCLVAWASANWAVAQTTAPADDPTIPEAVRQLKTAMDKGGMKLSTDATSALRRFDFVLLLYGPATTKPSLIHQFVGARRDDEAALLCWSSDDDLPFCYMREKMWVSLDPLRPGGLVACYAGGPYLALAGDVRGGRAQFQAGFQAAAGARLALDVQSLLSGALARTRKLDFLPKDNGLVLTTDRGVTQIRLAPGGAFPISEFYMSGEGGAGIKVTIGTDEPLLDILSVTRQGVEALGLPIRELSLDDAKGALSIAPPADLASNQRMRDAALKLKTLFPVRGRHGRFAEMTAKQVLGALLAEGKLEVSTDATSAVKRFGVICRLTHPASSGLHPTIDLLVVRDGDRCALDTVADRIPYCYMTKDLLVALDLANPGGLVIHEHGAPEFLTLPWKDGEGLCRVRYVPGDASTRACLDFASAVRFLAADGLETKFNPVANVLSFATKDRSGQVVFGDGKPSILSFQEFLVNRDSGEGMSVRVGAAPDRGTIFLDRARVRQLGLPVRTISDEQAAQLAPVPPAGFSKDQRVRQAGEALRGLFSTEAGERSGNGN